MWKFKHNSVYALAINTDPYILTLMLLLISLSSFSQEATLPPTPSDWLSGELELELSAGRARHDSDIAINQFLRLNADPPQHEQLHIRSTLWMNEDLDGRESPSSPFRGLNDTSSTWVNARLLSLYIEVENDRDASRFRVGRQRITEGVAYNRIDGIHFSTRQANWSYYAFLGARASVYENSHDDMATGTGISWRPAPHTRVAVDVFYGNDDRRRFSENHLDSSLTSLSMHHALAPRHTLFGRVTWHEKDVDELRLNTQGVMNEEALFYSLSYRKRVSTLAERPVDFPQFYHVVGELNGYEDLEGILSVAIHSQLEIGLEAQVHEAENSELTTGNRDYQRYGLSATLSEVARYYEVGILLEYWDAAQGESEKTISGEVSRRWARTHAAVGVDYDHFQDRIIQYDPVDQDDFYIESRDDIYALYLKVKHELTKQQSIRVRASIEEDDTTDAPYWRLHTHYSYRF